MSERSDRPSTKTVLSVGNCWSDHTRIEELISAQFDAQVLAASLPDEALQKLQSGSFDLILVNRKLDADASPGLELIERIKADPQLADVPVMLLSNYADAQQAAVSAGAERGFGKSELASPDTHERLARVLRT